MLDVIQVDLGDLTIAAKTSGPQPIGYTGAASRHRYSSRHVQQRCRPRVSLGTTSTQISEIAQTKSDDAASGAGPLDALRSWFSDLPKIEWRLSPKVAVKLRKIYYPFAVTRLTLGVDYDIQEKLWDFKWT
eukprot:Plantae.Rhodophyta-Hildenbrandia_rubra.ctg25661.p1 GENE.Plantae.Rhodophyta-Hildenbrandia_rubra.ctg25661~~Plantae.Rhodophyta-Hildenbrandia_rubra.ctg25661.p1  ORF type:complete len:131 (+),score=10.95 Plantae.Rhodophyta-Hildenbrandia_rubra.ctg25661:616-1008(+)